MRNCSDARARRATAAIAIAIAWCLSPSVRAARGPRAGPTLEDTASVEARQRVLVLPPRLVGDLPEHVRQRFETQIRDGMSRARFELMDLPAERREESTCVDATCVKSIGAAVDARYVVVPFVSEHTRNFDIRIEIYDAVSGDVLAQAVDRCEVCGTAELEILLADQAAVIARRIELLRPPPPRLIVHSTPPGAVVLLDGVEIGRTPLGYELDEGPHEVVLERRGHVSYRVRLDAVDGVDERIDAILVRETPSPAARTRKRPLRVAGAVLVAMGGAAAGVGAGLWSIDGRPYRRRCSGDDVDFAGRCRFQYETSTAGIAVTVTGLALVATGIALLVRDERSYRNRSAGAARLNGRASRRPAPVERPRSGDPASAR